MNPINVQRIYYEPKALYQKANTRNQRALIGYMIKNVIARDPIYGGAFKLLRDIEESVGIYSLETNEHPDVAMQIIEIAESAMLGAWDEWAFTQREIENILIQMNANAKKRGGEGK